MTGIPRPTILPSPDAVPFWQAAQRHELVLPHCRACTEPFFYPRTYCPRCGSRDLDWQPASGRGVLHAFCIHFQTVVAADRAHLPYVSAIVELAEGPRLMSYLVDIEPSPEAIRCDMPVSVCFVDLPDRQTLPVFAPDRTGVAQSWSAWKDKPKLSPEQIQWFIEEAGGDRQASKC